jgi:hypothetical protein
MLRAACSVVTLSRVAATHVFAHCHTQCRHIECPLDSALRVTTDELCAAIRAGFNDTRTIFEPAGACPAPTSSGVGLSGRGLSGSGATWDGAKWEWAGVCPRRTLTNSRGGSGGDSRMHSLCGHDMADLSGAGALALAGVVKYAQQVLRPHPPILTQPHTRSHAHTRARARTHTHTHRHTHIHTHTHTHTHTGARTHRHTQTCMHTQKRALTRTRARI